MDKSQEKTKNALISCQNLLKPLLATSELKEMSSIEWHKTVLTDYLQGINTAGYDLYQLQNGAADYLSLFDLLTLISLLVEHELKTNPR